MTDLQQFIDEVSGGFLSAKQLPEPKLAHVGVESGKDDAAKGILKTKYQATLPPDVSVSKVKW